MRGAGEPAGALAHILKNSGEPGLKVGSIGVWRGEGESAESPRPLPSLLSPRPLKHVPSSLILSHKTPLYFLKKGADDNSVCGDTVIYSRP